MFGLSIINDLTKKATKTKQTIKGTITPLLIRSRRILENILGKYRRPSWKTKSETLDIRLNLKAKSWARNAISNKQQQYE